MAIIYSYPIGAPKSIDLLLGTSTFDENIDGSVPGNPTVSFTVQSLLSMIATSTGAQTLQQVTNIGATTTNPVIFTSTVQTGALSSSTVTSNGFINNGTYKDGGGSVGAAGQRLSSTGTITEWVTDTGQGVTSVTGTSPIISSGGTTPAISLAVSGVTAATYTKADITVDSFGRITTAADGAVTDPTLSSNLSGQIELTASGGVTGGLGRTTLTGGTGVTITSSAGNNIVFTSTEGIVTSLTTTGTTGVSTLVGGVLNIPDYVNTQNTLTTIGTTGDATLIGGVLNVPNYTYTEVDTLQSVTARGATSNQAISLSNSLTMSGSGAAGYLYVTGNAATGSPIHTQGLAFAYNNSGGSRENEIFWNTGTTDVATNNASYLGFWNEFLNSGAGNARVSDLQVKLYGTGELALTGTTPTISNPYWRMPTAAAPNTGYVLAKSAGSIDLEWVLNSTPADAVTKTGTPVAGEIAFYNAATVIEGSSSYTYDGTNVSQNADTDVKNTIGRAVVDGGTINSDFAIFTHVDRTSALNYGFMVSPNGSTYINASGGSQGIYLLDDNATCAYFDSASSSLSGTKVVFSQYGSGTQAGTPTYNLQVDTSGNLIETSTWQTENTTISTAQLLALNGTPVTLLGAPGANKAYNIQQVVIYFAAGVTVFDFPGIIAISKGYGGDFNIQNSITNSASSIAQSMGSSLASGYAYIANIPITLSNPNANPTQGNGTLYISISYKVIDLGPTMQAG